MNIRARNIEAVTLDFYNTLVYHREGSGRGPTLMQYINSQGWNSDPWEHRVLYDLFERHATDYSPDLEAEEKRRYLEWLTARLFRLLNVCAPANAAAEHAKDVWRILGPSSLKVHSEVPSVLSVLRKAGYPLSIVSNWQCGLENFCRELGIAEDIDHIVASAEVGAAKPNPHIFHEVCARMRVQCDRVLHVGDSFVDDVEGARGVGMQVLMVERNGSAPAPNENVIRSLDQLIELLA